MKRGSAKDPVKQAAFKRAASLSKRYMHLKASQVLRPRHNAGYMEWCRRADSDTLRGAAKK